MPDSILVRRLQIKAIIVLFVCLISNVWRIGVMSHDDAVWLVGAQRSQFDLAWNWAVAQGRLYATVVGTLMLHGLRYDGTLYGELLKYGSFTAFLVAWTAVLWVYWGRRLALLSVTLFLGWHVLRIDGSALVSYPLLIWPTATALAGAILAGRLYLTQGASNWLVLSAIALVAGLFTNEALVVTFSLLVGLACAANYLVRLDTSPRSGRLPLTHRETLLFCATIATIALYALLAAGFAMLQPSKYDGHVLAPFDLSRIASVIASFSTSGSVLHDLFYPYTITFTDRITASQTRVFYQTSDALAAGPGTLEGLLLGSATSFLVYSIIAPPTKENNSVSKLPLWMAAALGLWIAIGTVLPVALTAKYQHWHIELGVMSNVTSILSHFGYSISLSAILLVATSRLRSTGGANWLMGCISVLAGLLTFVGVQTNQQIARDMRFEGARWAVFRQAIPFMQESGFNSKIILAPQFYSRSWFANVKEKYWTDYANAIFARSLSVKYRGVTPAELDAGADVLLYFMSGDRRSFDMVAAQLRTEKKHALSINRIAIELGQASQSSRAEAVLSYFDRRKGPQQVHVYELATIGPDRYILNGIDAVPGTINLTSQTTGPGL